jgi:hypothetical protein
MDDRIDPQAPSPQQEPAPQALPHVQGQTPQQQPPSMPFALGAAPMLTSPAARSGHAMEANADPRGPPPADRKWCALHKCKNTLHITQKAT